MKECPNCKKLFTDDLSYCLYDGTSLTDEIVDQSAPTEPAYTVGRSDPTQVLPNRAPPTERSPIIEEPESQPPSKLPYVVIGALVMTCAVLAVALLVMNLDRLAPASDPKAKIGNDVKSVPAPSPAFTTNSSPLADTTKPVNQPVNQPVNKPPAIRDPTGKWTGQWSTTSGTLLYIEIDLKETADNGVDGQIKWTLRGTARPDKIDKIGNSAIEYVRGTFEPATGIILMSGYKKDDPNDVIVMLDNYRLTVSPDGSKLTGLARNGGKWNGRLKLAR